MTESILKTKDVQKLHDVQKEDDSAQKEMMEVRDEKLPVELQKHHKVKSGDTLSGIAIKHHTTVAKICKLNNFKPTKTLQIGEKIRVH
jgi:LysM repeat protein